MARKATTVPVEDVKVGDLIYNGQGLMRINFIRHNPGSVRYAFNYADAVTGQEVNYFTADAGDHVTIITTTED